MMKISLTILEFVMLSLALQGVVLAIALLYTSKKLSSNRWIAAIIFSISICTIVRVIYTGLAVQDSYPWLVPVVFQPRMVIGPFIYFYTRGLLYGDKKLGIKDTLNFLPLLMDLGPQIAFVLFYSRLLYTPFIQNIYFSKAAQYFLFGVGNVSNLLAFLSLFIYSVISYRAVQKSAANAVLSVYKLKDIQWLKNLLHVFLGLTVLFLITIIIKFRPVSYTVDLISYILFIPLILFTYWLGASTFIRQKKMGAEDVEAYNKTPAKIYFTEADAALYHLRLINLMTNHHLYLDPLLKLDVLAAKLNLTERSISNLLNQHIGKNFNDFVNQYRVDAAKIKLADQNFNQYTIAAIAYECGFNSLATFQRCFKQFSGITPSQYLQREKNNLLVNAKDPTTLELIAKQ